MRVRLIATLFWVFVQHATIAAEPNKACAGIWAGSGVQPRVGDAYTTDELPSPNKESVLSFAEDAIHFSHVGRSPISLSLPINLSLTELVWSPNSQYFAINVSDASADGPWQTFIYSIKGDLPKLVSMQAINSEIETLAQCENKQRANYATIAFLASDELLVVLEAPGITECRNRGERAAFRLSPMGALVEKLPKEFLNAVSTSNLGCRLR